MIVACWLLLAALTSPSCQAFFSPPVALALEGKKAKKSVVDEVSYKRDQPLKYPLVLIHDAAASRGVGRPPIPSQQDGAKNVHKPGESDKRQRNLLLRFGRSVNRLTLCSGCSNARSTALSGEVRHLDELSKTVESTPTFVTVVSPVTGTRSVSRRKRGSCQSIHCLEGLARGPASWTRPSSIKERRRSVPGTSKSTREADARNVKITGEIVPGSSKTAVKIDKGLFRTVGNAGTDEHAPDSTVITHVEGFRASFPRLVHGSSFSRLGKKISGGFSFPKRDKKMGAVHSQSEKVHHFNFIRFG